MFPVLTLILIGYSLLLAVRVKMQKLSIELEKGTKTVNNSDHGGGNRESVRSKVKKRSLPPKNKVMAQPDRKVMVKSLSDKISLQKNLISWRCQTHTLEFPHIIVAKYNKDLYIYNFRRNVKILNWSLPNASRPSGIMSQNVPGTPDASAVTEGHSHEGFQMRWRPLETIIFSCQCMKNKTSQIFT